MTAQHLGREIRLRLESLERRDLMTITGLAALLNSSGQLTISATAASTCMINEVNNQISGSGISGSVAASSVKSIVINCDGGNDLIRLDSASVKGQQALSVPITIKAGAGNDDVRLASGLDVFFSGTGNALSVTAKGVATLDNKALTWFDTNIHDSAIRSLADADFAAGNVLTRNEMIALFNQVEKAGAVTQTEFNDLKAIVSDSALFGTLTYVQVLSDDVVLGNAANAHYLGGNLGNLAVGSSAQTLNKLVDKWFLGTDLPLGTSDWGPTYGYAQASGSLFVNGASYTDIYQGGLGDCYFLSALAEVAKDTPAAISSMFIANGDNTYTVRFYDNGKADYVTVNTQLPVDQYGRFVFANMGNFASNKGNELWVALAEKAFVQWHETGLENEGSQTGGTNEYTAISGGWMGTALSEITGKPDVMFNSVTASNSFASFVNAYNSGNLIEFASLANPSLSTVVGDHAYAVVGYNAVNHTITLFNPWGINNGSNMPGLITLTWAQVETNFYYYDRAV